ncbi:hypothetical protein [Cupriavidus sp. TMH.W2]|uniref:hypothetical protein n=1 Tax=Cupriavidus sp. TMH.W2 TaxID=3434465 RepID=UPI003D77B159
MTKSNQRTRIGVEEPREYTIGHATALPIQRKARYDTASVSLKITYVLVLLAVAVGVWVATERAAMPNWAQIVLPALAVAGARSAMRLAYAARMAAQHRKQLAVYAERLGQMSRATNN